MLAAEAYGKDQSGKLDSLTVPLPHPDAMAALLSGHSEITAHFTAAPYYQQEEAAGLNRVLSSYAILGGPAAYSVALTSKKFIDQNQKTAHALLAPTVSATQIAQKDPSRPAQT